ncbi:MAG: competence/damage-inducible protein A [Planctomycetota bacterium]|nr:competence/damage-inducible protein A [Planctomycetota bacterium]
MKAAILSIGDELVLGQTVDTNSAYLSDQLVRLGIPTLFHQTIADDQAATTEAVIRASKTVDLILISGGLGPTEDDLTRQALADAMGEELVLHEPSVEVIRAMFGKRGREMPERNKVQAMHPAGSQMIPNSCGTAPGIHARLHQAAIYVMPGVPSEMFAMFQKSVLPDLQKHTGTRDVILTAKVNTFGMGESTVGEKLGELMNRTRNPKVGTTVADGFVSVRVRSEFPDAAKAQAELDDTLAQVEARLGSIVFGRDAQRLQESLVALLKAKGLKLATAESCTGGALGKMVTDVAGSSAAYVGGWVTYANAMKQSQLGVPEAMLKAHGAVSQPVARAMAAGALERGGADVALAITGVAGPDGGTPEKPVGLVWIALAFKDKAGRTQTDALRCEFGSGREMVRDRATKSAMQLLRFQLLGMPLDQFSFGKRVAE